MWEIGRAGWWCWTRRVRGWKRDEWRRGSRLWQRFPGCERMRIALETGTHSPWVSRLLMECGHEVIVANSRKLRLIYENRRKDDRVDALSLARLARVDPQLLSPVEHRGPEVQKDLALLRSRDALIRARTQLINHARGAVKSLGHRLPSASSRAFPKRVLENDAGVCSTGVAAGSGDRHFPQRSDQSSGPQGGDIVPGELSGDEASSAGDGSRADHCPGLCADPRAAGWIREQLARWGPISGWFPEESSRETRTLRCESPRKGTRC